MSRIARNKLFLVCLTLFCNLCFNGAQAQKYPPQLPVDSLLSEWNNVENEDSLRFDALYNVVNRIFIMYDPDTAVYYAKKLEDFASERNTAYYNANSIYTQAMLCERKRDMAGAMVYYDQAIPLYDEINDYRKSGECYLGITMIYVRTGDFAKAVAPTKKALELLHKANDPVGLARSYNIIGNIHTILGDMAASFDYLNQALKYSKQIQSKSLTANTMNNIAMVCERQGDDEKAVDYYKKSMEIKKEIGDGVGYARTSSNFGMYLQSLKKYDEALKLTREGLQVFLSMEDKEAIAQSYTGLGTIYKNMEIYDSSLMYFHKSYEISKSLGDPNQCAITNYGIGAYYLKKEMYDSAYYYGKLSSDSLMSQGDLENMQKALNVKYLGAARVSGEDEKYTTLNTIKRYVDDGVALNYFSFSEKEKEVYFSTQVFPYYALYYDFGVNNHTTIDGMSDTLYNMALRSKGLSLKSTTALRRAILSSGDDNLIANYEQWIEMKKMIAKKYAMGAPIDKDEEAARALEQSLIKQSSIFANFNNFKNLNWHYVRDGLKKGEAAIEFVHFKSEIDERKRWRYAALIITPGCKSPTVVDLCWSDEIDGLVQIMEGNSLKYVEQVYGTNNETNNAIYKLIWQPLEKHLKKVNTVHFAPAGIMHKISFASLGIKKNYYLCDRYNLNQMGSTQKVTEKSINSFSKEADVLLIGGVQYNSDSTETRLWSYLAGTKKETDNIYNIIKDNGNNVSYLSGMDAREERVKQKAENADIIHISTHGFFFPDPDELKAQMNEFKIETSDIAFRGSTNYAEWNFVSNKNPLMRSGLVLSCANDVWQRSALVDGEDGILTAEEVANLDLRKAKVVVLSACETGLGDVKGAEGVYGLQRAFKLAGANSLIMSLWQVPDNETAEFMSKFYKYLKTSQSLEDAFRSTQLEMRKKLDPYFWAAFVLIK